MLPDSLRTPAEKLLRLLSWNLVLVLAVFATALFAAPSFAGDDDDAGDLVGQADDDDDDKGKGNSGKGGGGDDDSDRGDDDRGGDDSSGRGNGRDRGPVTPPAPPKVERPDPPRVERPDPPKQQRPDPPRVERPDPPKQQRPDPPKQQRPDPPKTERPDPPKPERPDPPRVERPDRPERPDPPRVERPDPPERPDRPEVERPDRPEAERPDRPKPSRPTPRSSRPDQPRQSPQPSNPRPVQRPNGADGRVDVDSAAPVTGGNPPAGSVPGATGPAPATSAPSSPSYSGRVGGGQAPRLGSLVDSADRSRGGGSSPRPVTGSAGGGGTRMAGAPVVRQDARGGVTYEVAGSGGRPTRQVRVPGGVFGAMPAAGIEATQEVAGATEEGRTLGRASSDSEETGVVRVLSQPLAVFDEVTGGRVSPLLLLAALAAILVASAVGIRRGLHRW